MRTANPQALELLRDLRNWSHSKRPGELERIVAWAHILIAREEGSPDELKQAYRLLDELNLDEFEKKDQKLVPMAFEDSDFEKEGS